MIPPRRQFVLGMLALFGSACRSSGSPAPTSPSGDAPAAGTQETPRAASTPEPSVRLAELEQKVGGRMGVFALDTQTGTSVFHRPDERFALCSTFKWLLAAHVLHRVDGGALALEERVPFSEKDVLEHAPVARARLGEGALSTDELCRAAVVVSDNTAANLLLAKVGGPGGLTAFLRSLGDDVTRLDRDEPSMNSNEPGDPRDTTSPRAMVHSAQKLLCEPTLSAGSRERLLGWLIACETGKNRLRAGLPPDWKVGDKTGTGNRNAVNDVVIAWPPGRGPVLIASYFSESSAALPDLEAAHAEVARVVASELAPG